MLAVYLNVKFLVLQMVKRRSKNIVSIRKSEHLRERYRERLRKKI
jgi:hypothetical protein